MNIKLTPRLERIAKQVKKGNKVADIGTDHGYIPIYLLENKISPFIIAGDINRKPLESAENNINKHGLLDKVETRLGSGLTILKPGEVNTAIIAGMGGLLIRDLLAYSKDIVKELDTLILQPMKSQSELRKYLVSNGFTIIDDILVKEDYRIYEIIIVKNGYQEPVDPIYYDIGFHIENNPKPLAREFVERKIKEAKNIIKNIRENSTNHSIEKSKEVENKLKKLEEVLLCLQK